MRKQTGWVARCHPRAFCTFVHAYRHKTRSGRTARRFNARGAELSEATEPHDVYGYAIGAVGTDVLLFSTDDTSMLTRLSVDATPQTVSTLAQGLRPLAIREQHGQFLLQTREGLLTVPVPQE